MGKFLLLCFTCLTPKLLRGTARCWGHADRGTRAGVGHPGGWQVMMHGTGRRAKEEQGGKTKANQDESTGTGCPRRLWSLLLWR